MHPQNSMVFVKNVVIFMVQIDINVIRRAYRKTCGGLGRTREMCVPIGMVVT